MKLQRIEELPDSGKGIYIIRNVKTDKFYIGSTTESFRRRALHHRCCLRGNYHTNVHLQNSYNKHGEDCFEFIIKSIIQQLDSIISTEQALLDQYNEMDWSKIYNINNKADRVTFTEDVRNKKSKSMKENWKDPEFREMMISSRSKVWNKGKTGCFSQETLDKMSESAKNRANKKEVERKRIEAIKDKTNKVAVYNLDEHLIGIYESAEAVEKASLRGEIEVDEHKLRFKNGPRASNHLKPPSIRSVCNGHKDSYKGFLFKYVD